MNQLAVEVRGLRKSFGEQTVLDGIDLAVRRGGIFALLGPNGAGKTTLIHILSTLVAPDAGKVLVNGFHIVHNREEVQRSISLTGQFAAVDEMLTAEENLRMMGRPCGLSRAEAKLRAEDLLSTFDLTYAAQKMVKTFSGGMRRRLDLAVSLVIRRDILFLDEPTTGLDTQSRRSLWDMILKLSNDGVTIFLTTQYLEEADQLADTIAVLHKGRIVAQGTPEEMKSQVGQEVVEVRNDWDEVIREISTNGEIQDMIRILQGLEGEVPEGARISIRRPSLDDVFLSLTAKEGQS